MNMVILDRAAAALIGATPAEALEESKRTAADILRTPLLRRSAQGLILLLAVLIVVHATLAVGAIFGAQPFDRLWKAGSWRLDVDNSIPEKVEFVLLLLAAGAMALCWRRTRAPIHLTLAALVLYIFLDGALMLHERLGPSFNATSGWRGELGFFICVGAALGTMVLLALHRTPARWRASGVLCLGAFAGLAGCAVVVDTIHTIASYKIDSKFVTYGLALLEDGGEMLFIMLNTLISLATLHRAGLPVPMRALDSAAP